MADYLTRACRLQLATAMENLIRTAVLEVSQIFEDSLHDHQVELSLRREEIVHLKVKLQRAELRLRDITVEHDTDMSTAQLSESPKNSEAPPLEETTAAESVYEVPGDWCVPLDSDYISKQENPCPSVRLKQCSIPLWPIPLKHKAFLNIPQQRLRRRDHGDKIGIQPPIKRKPGRPRVRPLDDPRKDVRLTIKQEPSTKRKPGRPRVRPLDNLRKDVRLTIKQEPSTKRKTGRPKASPRGRLYKDVLKNIKQEPSDSDMEAPTQTISPSGQKYRCRFCPKVFDTQFGLSVHHRSHKKCTGCKRIFPFPSALRQHKTHCKYYKRNVKFTSLLAEKRSSRIQQKTSVENPPGKKIRRGFICKKCLRRFRSRSIFMKHSCNFVCNICSKRFSCKTNLNVHKGKVHKNLTENILEAAWTKPLGYSEESGENKFISREKEENLRTGAFNRTCKQCLRTCTSRSALLTHACEFPCPICSKTFSCRSNLNIHKGKVHKNRANDEVEASWTKPLDEDEQSPESRSSPRDKGKHRKGENTCKQCQRKCVSRTELLTHTCLEFICPICSKKFSCRLSLNIHVGKIHKKRTQKNPTDNLLEASWAKPLDESEQSPENESGQNEKGMNLRKGGSAKTVWTCKKCLRNCTSRSVFLTHTCLEFSCPICSKSFSCKANLNIHKGKIHKTRGKKHKKRVDCKVEESWTKPLDESKTKESKPKVKNPHIKACDLGFKCLFCKQVLASKQSALDHVYSHTGEKPYKCDYCPSAFSYRSLLSLHRSSAHGMQIRGSRKCVCSRTFLYRKSFELHVSRCSVAIAHTKEEHD
ncbi:unnamed protein product [Knipowitschia caucasica]